jgi:uncharacterized protein (DUF2384 family)
MTQDTPLTPDSLAALRARFDTQSRKAQTYYSVMHEVRRVLGSDEAASIWMEAPLAAFDGKTPAALVGAGRAREVRDQIGACPPVAPRG